MSKKVISKVVSKKSQTIISHSAEETQKFAEEVAEKLMLGSEASKLRKQAAVICLYGDLGAGKTTFVQGFAKALGIKQRLTSPTFVILKKYEIRNTKYETNSKSQNFKFKTLIHVDAYRLKSGEEMKALNWKETLADSQNMILIEWPENIKSVLPKECVIIKFEHVEEDRRRIKMTKF